MSPLDVLLGHGAVVLALALVATGAARFSRRPPLVHALWLLVIAKLLTPPLYAVPLLPVAGPEAVLSSPPLEMLEADPVAPLVAAGAPAPAGGFEFDLPLFLGLLWAAGSLALLALGVARSLRFRALVRKAEPADESLRDETARWAARLGMRRVPEVRTVDARIPPLVFSFGRAPIVLLPARLLAQVDGERRAALIVHELAHVRRRDHLVRYAEAAATVLFFWNPVAWWARRGLRRAEEECCDAWVVWALPGGSEAYARAIVDTLDFVSESGAPVPALGSGLRPVDSLKRRLTMIMTERTPRSLPPFLRVALLAGAALALPPIVGYAEAGSETSEAPVVAAAAVPAGLGGSAAVSAPIAPAGSQGGVAVVSTARAPASVPAPVATGEGASLGYAGEKRRAAAGPNAPARGAKRRAAPEPDEPQATDLPPGAGLGYMGGGKSGDATPAPPRRRGAPPAGAPAPGALRRSRNAVDSTAPGEPSDPSPSWRDAPPPPPDETAGPGTPPPGAGVSALRHRRSRAGADEAPSPDSAPAVSAGPFAGGGGSGGAFGGSRAASARSGRRRTAPPGPSDPFGEVEAGDSDRIRALEDEMRQLADRLESVRREIESLKSSGEKRPRSTGAR